MEKKIIIAVLIAVVIAIPFYANISYAGKKWNNPSNQKHYINALKQSSVAYRNAAKEQNNYLKTIDRTRAGAKIVKNASDVGVSILSKKTGPAGRTVGIAYKTITSVVCRGNKCS